MYMIKFPSLLDIYVILYLYQILDIRYDNILDLLTLQNIILENAAVPCDVSVY